jgi:mannosyl-3-phosphoglycerate phosphatase
MGAGSRRGYRWRMSLPAIVFADIDGMPLAIDDGHRRLPETLAMLADERIVLVFLTSRTRAEVEGFRQSIGVFHPFVCERGSVAFVPRGYFGPALADARIVGGYESLDFGLPYATVVDLVHRTADQLRIGVRGFSDMSVEQVSRECGGSLLEARLAKLREFGEPFRLLREDPVAECRLVRALEGLGLSCARHGAFLHAAYATGAGAAVAALRRLYASAAGPIATAVAGRTTDDTIGRHVDFVLHSGFGRGFGETLCWIEDIVDRVRMMRRPPGPVSTAPSSRDSIREPVSLG